MHIDLSVYEPKLLKALAHGGNTHTIADLTALAERGLVQVWPGPTSVIITELGDHPRCRLLTLVVAAGNLRELEAMLPGVLAWGKSRGATRAVFAGRRGWSRPRKSSPAWDGWEPTLVVMEKAL